MIPKIKSWPIKYHHRDQTVEYFYNSNFTDDIVQMKLNKFGGNNMIKEDFVNHNSVLKQLQSTDHRIWSTDEYYRNFMQLLPVA